MSNCLDAAYQKVIGVCDLLGSGGGVAADEICAQRLYWLTTTELGRLGYAGILNTASYNGTIGGQKST